MTGRDAGVSWRVLRLAREEPGQVLRLQAFRTAHPHVIIGDAGFGVWQARIPEQDGERIISRYMLRELLDKLDEIAGEPGSQADSRSDYPPLFSSEGWLRRWYFLSSRELGF